MQKQDHNECPFSDEIVSYIYDEIADPARAKFEQHLAACQVCTDDFAAVSVARFETYDWKRTEFDPLATPRIVIPYREKTVSLGERISAWMSWVTVAPAVATLLVMLGLGYVFVLRNTTSDQGPVASNPVKIDGPAAPRPAAVQPPIATPEIAKNNSNAVNTVKPQQIVAKKKVAVPRTQMARVLTPVKLGNDVALNIPSTQLQRPPRLASYEEEKDNSLRLSDLFDDGNPPQQR